MAKVVKFTAKLTFEAEFDVDLGCYPENATIEQIVDIEIDNIEKEELFYFNDDMVVTAEIKDARIVE